MAALARCIPPRAPTAVARHRSRSAPAESDPSTAATASPPSAANEAHRPRPIRTGGSTTHMANGTIKKLISDRGFGFITADDGKDYFFHRDGLNASLDFDRLVGGEKVSFDVESSPRGPRATNVRADA